MKRFSIYGLVLCAAMAASCSSDEEPGTASQPNAPGQVVTQPQTPYVYDPDETQMVGLINAHRREIGKPALALEPYASSLAQTHNAYMIANHVVNHDLFEQRARNLTETIGAFSVAENVAFNYQASAGAFYAWLESEGHRASIEGNFSHLGMSVTADSEGNKYYTAIFFSVR